MKKTLDGLRKMNTATVSNSLAAEVLGMDPGRLKWYANNGQLPWTTIGSGNRVKHSREQLIEYWGGRK